MAKCLLALVIPIAATAAVLHVYPEDSIQSAVNAAEAGDTVLVHEGLYWQKVVPYGKDVTIGSKWILDGDTAHIVQTVIEPDPSETDTGSCFVYANGETAASRLAGLCLRNGWGTRVESSTWPTGYSGGAVLVRHASAVSIDNCVIESSSGMCGGGICVWGNENTRSASATVTNTTVQNCSAVYSGGGIFGRFGIVLLDGCCIAQNSCTVWGGGSCVVYADILWLNSSFLSNESRTVAGLASLLSSGVIDGCLFDGNRITGPTMGWAAHMVLDQSDISVTGSVFRNSEGLRDAIYFSQTPVHFRYNLVADHVCTALSGPLVLYQVSGEIAGNAFVNNGGAAGCVIDMYSPQLAIHHNVFSGNWYTGLGNYGSALSINCPAQHIYQNTFAGNLGVAVMTEYQDYSIDLTGNWWGHPSGPYHVERNPGGQGDTLTQDSLLFEPWLTAPPDTTDQAAPGRRGIPANWELVDVYPNPFNQSARIIVAGITGPGFRISLCDILGREVAVIHHGPGTTGEIEFRASASLASGIYFVRATDGIHLRTRKLVLLK